MIEERLAQELQTRNSDIALTIAVWKMEYPGLLVRSITGDYHVPLNNLYRLPSQDDIKRLRAKIQNEEGRFLPTDPAVVKARHIEEEKWRAAMGYDNPAKG